MSSSSSSDSDSDDLEPIRKIKINIKPKEEVGKKDGADIDVLKATIEAWRPLGPRPHQSLTRRQPSMSSVSSLSFGMSTGYASSNSNTATPSLSNVYNPSYTRSGNMRSSPSCSSLVNEFNNRSSFSNFMTNNSRTSSPLTLMNNIGDTVPIAIAIQESIEMIVRGSKGPNLNQVTKFNSRALGNIKVAFPNTFAQRCYAGHPSSSFPVLKLRMHSSENIIRYYASRLIKDLDLGASNNSNEVKDTAFIDADNSNYSNKNYNLLSEDKQQDKFSDLFDLDESPTKGYNNSKIIEFDMDALVNQLNQLYEQSPNSRYYNVDVLRYQIAPIEEFDKCPLQVCAYWKSEQKLTKIRIDFKHSNKCGLNLERLRDIKFIVDLTNFIPPGVDINSLTPELLSAMKSNDNNNHDDKNSATSCGAAFETTRRQPKKLDNYLYATLENNDDFSQQPRGMASVVSSSSGKTNNYKSLQTLDSGLLNLQQQVSKKETSAFQIKLPPPPSSGNHSHYQSRVNNGSRSTNTRQTVGPVGCGTVQSQQMPPPIVQRNSLNQSNANNHQPKSLLDSSTGSSASTLNQMHQEPLIPLKGKSTSNNEVFTDLFKNPSHGASINYNLIDYCEPQVVSSTNRTVSNPLAVAKPPYITYEPQAHWNNDIKQLTWKFDNLLSYYKSDGYGSLLAKLDFRSHPEILNLESVEPHPIDVKFMVADSTLSKISISVDTTGYRMSLLKKEIRSGRYKSEPNIF